VFLTGIVTVGPDIVLAISGQLTGIVLAIEAS